MDKSKAKFVSNIHADSGSNNRDISYISSQLQHLAVLCDTLVYDSQNARRHPEGNLTAIKGSLSRYGQQKPIVVRKGSNIVLAGNGTLQAARELKWQWIAAVVVEMDDISAMGFAIADNRTAELAEWDYERLSGMLRTLQQEQVDLEQQGWMIHELEPLILADWIPVSDSEETGIVSKSWWEVLVTCNTEQDQVNLVERLMKEGYKCYIKETL